MARTYYITAPPAVAGSHIRYTAHEVRCIVALFSLRSQSRGLRRWLRLRWWLLVSSSASSAMSALAPITSITPASAAGSANQFVCNTQIQPGFTEPTLALLAWR